LSTIFGRPSISFEDGKLSELTDVLNSGLPEFTFRNRLARSLSFAALSRYTSSESGVHIAGDSNHASSDHLLFELRFAIRDVCFEISREQQAVKCEKQHQRIRQRQFSASTIPTKGGPEEPLVRVHMLGFFLSAKVLPCETEGKLFRKRKVF
jgi:hypothetical protein